MNPTPYSLLAVMAAAIALVGCESPRNQTLSEADLAQLQNPVCETTAHCNTMWQRAQLWVVNNAAYRIQTANDVVIQTYNPSKSSVKSGMTITREPIGGEKSRIIMRTYCDNMFGCNPTDARLRIALHSYLRETQK